MRARLLSVACSLIVATACGGSDRRSPTNPTPISSPVVNLLTNGSFEGGPPIPSSSSYTTLFGGSRAIPSWVVTGSSIDYIGTHHPPSDGLRTIDLDGAFSTGGVTQTFSTTPGSRYLVTFDLSGNPEGAPRIKQLRVTVAGVVRDFTFDTAGQSRIILRWEPVSFSFSATGTSTTITFVSLSPSGNSWGPLVDRAAVTAE